MSGLFYKGQASERCETSIIKNNFAYDLHSRYSVMMPSYCTVCKKGPVKGSVIMHRFPPLSKPEQRHQWLSGLDSGGKRCMATAPLTGPFLQTIQYDGIITEYLEWRS